MALPFSSSIYNLRRPLVLKLNPIKYRRVRSQSFRDDFQEGKATNHVDANMHVLKQRMDEVRIKQRSNTHQCAAGWTYGSHNYTIHNKGGKISSNSTLLIMSDFKELIGQMGATFALVFVSGSLGICLISLLVRLCSHL